MTTREVFDLVEAGREHAFYCSAAWHRKRAAVLKRDRYECQLCKARGRYRKAELVHHVNHLKDRPDLALRRWRTVRRRSLRRKRTTKASRFGRCSFRPRRKQRPGA